MQTPSALGLIYESWRPGQQLAVRTALSAKTHHIVIQAPTGSGKSAIALALTKLAGRRSAILTASKGLQQQYLGEAPWLTDIRGMANYPCLAAEDEFKRYFPLRTTTNCDDGPCQSGEICTLREMGCLYFDRYRAALAARVVMTNYDYWMAIRRFGQGLGTVDVLVCDEAHAVAEKLMSSARLTIPHSMLPKKLPDNVEGWRGWAASALSFFPEDDDHRRRSRRMRDTLETLQMTLDTAWAWEAQGDSIVFEPLSPAPFLGTLTNLTGRVVYLSATVTPHTLKLLGVSPDDVTFCVLESQFPISHRPTYVIGTARVDYRMTDAQKSMWLAQIDDLIDARLDRKGLIHTVSYARQQWLVERSRHRGIMLAPRGTAELERMIQRFRQSRPPKILVSPSITTGYNFPYGDAEYQLIIKLPFPDTTSPITKRRLKAIPGYREHLTMQTLEQATGRLVRADDDQGETIILDDHAYWFLSRHRELASRSFLESVQFTRRVPHPLPKLS